MKVKKKANKKNWFNKIFIKICRLLDYEIIDQSNFYLPVTDQYINEDLSKIGKKSLTNWKLDIIHNKSNKKDEDDD